ncbi:MAG: hypothetical protein WC557_03535 [Ignavibacteriaceae bacterium]
MINKVAANKIQYHISKSKLPFEEKFKIIISLQAIDLEFRKNNPHKKVKTYFRVWQ